MEKGSEVLGLIYEMKRNARHRQPFDGAFKPLSVGIAFL